VPNATNRMLRTAAARADFLESGRSGAAGVPDIVAASWERSQTAGVDHSQPCTDFSDEIDTGSLLMRCARPVLRQLGTDVGDTPMVIALTDSRARVIQRIDISGAVGRLLDRVNFAPGFRYSEDSMGTNGVGTVFEAGQPISVVGPEHFAENLQTFACTGAPIIDPVTRRIEGVLDISTLSTGWSPLMHTLVKAAAKDIARNLLLDRSQSQQAIFDTYIQIDAKAGRQAVLAFGDSVFMANAAAQALFSSAEQQLLRDHAIFMMGRRDKASDTIALPDDRLVTLRGTRILVGSEVAGLVVIAEIASAPRFGLPGDFDEHVLPQIAIAGHSSSRVVGDLTRQQYQSVAVGSTPAWVRACEQVRQVLTENQPAVVIGESGSGKFTLVAEIFHDAFPDARSVSIDACQIVDEGDTDVDLDTMLAGQAGPTLFIIRNIDQASTEGAEQISNILRALAEHEEPTWCVATLSDSSLDSDLPFQMLLSHFEVAITVPPLRLRTDDLPQIVASVLRQIAPERRVRLSPAAMRVVSRYSWPRNVTQLTEALQHALRQRPVGEIQEQDLPGYCQTTVSHNLTPLEQAERDAIVAALREFDGNRVAAAAHLGMARSSLYRKLRTYGITA